MSEARVTPLQRPRPWSPPLAVGRGLVAEGCRPAVARPARDAASPWAPGPGRPLAVPQPPRQSDSHSPGGSE